MYKEEELIYVLITLHIKFFFEFRTYFMFTL